MKTAKEYQDYKKAIEEEYGPCTVLRADADLTKKNCGNTGNRTAPKGWSWIDYWRAMTGNYSQTLTCRSCGKEIFNDEPTEKQKKEFSKDGDDPKNHIAQGGHIYVNAPANANYTGGRYIVPLCPHCNGQHDNHIPIKKGSRYCKELGANVDK